MPELITYNIEGTGAPVIAYRDGTKFTLPEPSWEEGSREELRSYYFTKNVRDSYLSEGNKRIEIGVTYAFGGSIKFFGVTKQVLEQLFKAKNDDYINIVLNEDKEEINFNVRVDFEYKFIKGFKNHPKGYSIILSFEGSEELDSVGYAGLGANSDYGSDYGGGGNQPY